MMVKSNWDGLGSYAPHALGVLRIVTALLFMQHGFQKLFAFPDAGHHPGPFVLFSLAGIGGILEAFGGLAILLGVWTRPIAFILSGQMAVAYWLFHFVGGLSQPRGYFPVVNGGDAAILYCFVFLFLVFAGPGRFTLPASRQGVE
jgi:putative oxidoreductase